MNNQASSKLAGTSKVVLITGASSGFGAAISGALAGQGHIVYASMRGLTRKNADKAEQLRLDASERGWALTPIELDVLSEESARAAVERILDEQGRIDVLINNAGMLVMGVTEAFSPEQVLRTFDTNAVSWLRMARAVLPTMRKQGDGLLLYIGSVTSRILSPFQGPYVASKAAADALAETIHYENTRYGIDTAIVQPGAYIEGTSHFSGAVRASGADITAAYDRIADLPTQLERRLAGLVPQGRRTDVGEVVERVIEIVETPKGKRPFRVVVDPQSHGAEAVNDSAARSQRDFFRRFGIEDLLEVRTEAV